MIQLKLSGNWHGVFLTFLLLPLFSIGQIDIGSYFPGNASTKTLDAFFQQSNPQTSDCKLNYLAPLAYLYSIDVNQLDSQQLSLYYTQKGTALSFVGQFELGKKTADSALLYNPYFRLFSPTKNDSMRLSELRVESASAPILKKATDAAMLFISEEHSSPEHRLLTYSLLSDLKKIGYNYLALETVASSPDSMSDFSVNVGTGFYTAEPTMANLIRYAHRLGLEIIQYDCTSCNSSQDREEVAASNLLTIMARDSTNRMIVHCGFGHASKAKIGSLSMLAKLMIDKLSPGKKVVSVAQHVIGQSMPGTYKDFLYSYISRKHRIDSQKVLFDQGSPFSLFQDSSFDLTVLNPVVGQAGLNSFRTADLKAVNLTFNLSRNSLYLCQLFPLEEIKEEEGFDRIVPASNSLVLQNREVSLLVPPGNYYQVIRDNKNQIISKRKIVVE